MAEIADPLLRNTFCRLHPSYEIACFGLERPVAGPGENSRVHREFFGGFIFPRGGQGIFESGGTTDGFFLPPRPRLVGTSRGQGKLPFLSVASRAPP